MTIKELKNREVCFLNSNKIVFEEYGRAYKEIIKLCEKYAGPILSETMLISDMALQFIKKEKLKFDLTKNEKYQLHIRIAFDLVITKASSKYIYEYLKNKYKKNMTWDDIHYIFKKSDFYENVCPVILTNVLATLKEENNEIYQNNAE